MFDEMEVKKVSVNIKMPKWDPAMKAGEITRWFKQAGDEVNKGEALCEVKTDKNTSTVESPAGGRLSQIMIPAGKGVPVKVVVAVLAEPGE
jgi:pyruvate dehydrogenase E2 component (dihydrolipoamide acetyltransferase)